MTYKLTDATKLNKHLNKLKPGDFLLVSNGFSSNNLTLVNLDNAAIRLASLSRYGHAMLYLGAGKAMEMPLAKGQVSSIFAQDKTNGAAFVHCKKLTNKQRQVIVAVAGKYYKAKKSNAKGGYDILSMVAGGVATVGGSAADIVSFLVFQSNWAGRAVEELLQTPATAAACIDSVFTKYPSLTCSSLVTYIHAAAGHIVRPGLLRHPTSSSPRALWDAVKADKSRFTLTQTTF